ncbi:uncharacterized protein LOC110707688 [Chenopodium quinoa]|uniref:uncharacterized protein LOC110707688 n=1 Tax=Chenopodium quinoa TaxID=63459 RepID=UPI000B77B8C0|nr:uncharacterized protein LOC110707688 [Chenopodium quinoa]
MENRSRKYFSIEAQIFSQKNQGIPLFHRCSLLSFELAPPQAHCSSSRSALTRLVLVMEPERGLSTQKSSKVKNEEKKANFRWSKDMSKELLNFLAEEVKKGNRPNNTFRTSSFVAAAKIISEKFQTNCTSEHVENHMKTVRNAWVAISTVRNSYGFGWNDNLKMVTTSPTAYATYVKEYPKYEKFFNRKIDMYEEMAIVVGKDLARGNFSKTFSDIDVDASMESGQPSMTIDSVPSKAESKADSGTSSGSRPH